MKTLFPMTMLAVVSLCHAPEYANAAGPVSSTTNSPLSPVPDADSVKRWKAWDKDLQYLFKEIEKPSSLKKIFKEKGIDWKKVKKEAEKRLDGFAKGAKKSKGGAEEEQLQKAQFYGVLEFVISQLRDSHAHLKAKGRAAENYRESLPKRHQAGIEFLQGDHGLILVSNTFAGRGSNSPLYGKGVRHECTWVDTINGVAAPKFFEERAREVWEDEGWQSSPFRAHVESMNKLDMGDGDALKFVFQTLDSSDKVIERYLETPPEERAKAFKKLKWKKSKVSLRFNECAQTQNPRNFVFMHLPRPELQKTVDKGVYYAKLDSGFGYIATYSVSQQSRAAYDAALEELADCPGLILDMRMNGGGGHSGVEALHRKRGSWSKPVAVLMGPKTMSQGETEIWAIREMREQRMCNARLFGQTTAGSSGRKAQFELPSGFASGQFVIDHWDGGQQTIEGRGIEPDEVVLQDVVELSRGIDSCRRAAEAWLAAGGAQ